MIGFRDEDKLYYHDEHEGVLGAKCGEGPITYAFSDVAEMERYRVALGYFTVERRPCPACWPEAEAGTA